MKRAYDNEAKQNMRWNISAIIKHHFKDAPVSMLELLGEGVGAEHYIRENNIKKLIGVEQVFGAYYKFLRQTAPRINKERSEAGLSEVEFDINLGDLYQLLDPSKQCDVVNFDFCGWFQLEPMSTRRSSSEILDKAFSNGVIADGGLLLTNFQIKGQSVSLNPVARKHAILDGDEIEKAIKNLAMKHGYILHTHYDNGNPFMCGSYKPHGRTAMFQSVFVCNRAS